VYRYSDSGQLVFPVGYWPAVKELLTEHVEEVRSLVLPLPPSFRAEAFVPDFAHMMSVFGRTDSSFFRYRQDEALAAVIAACQTGVGGIIDAPTGIGKSFIISALVMALRHAKIDIVAPSVSTVRNLYRRLIALTPHLSQVGGGKRETPKRLTLYCADSLHHASHEPGEEADLVIFDEVHEAGADTAIEQLAQYRSAVKIGLTASYQYRFDNRDHLLEGLFGPRLFYMSYTEAAEHGLVVPIHVNWLVCGDGMAKVNSRMSMANRMRMLYWQNAERCAALAEVARTHLAAGDQVLVMALRSVSRTATTARRARRRTSRRSRTQGTPRRGGTGATCP
jgi:superfamily II DNA or RNA helicase